jgi:hypothetical protein
VCLTSSFLYPCFFSFLSIATPLLITTSFCFFLSSNTIPYLIFYHKRRPSMYIDNELFSDNFAKIFCLSLSLLFLSSYTLLTSHTHITLLLFITLFCQIFYVQTHNNTSILQSVLFVTAVKYKRDCNLW